MPTETVTAEPRQLVQNIYNNYANGDIDACIESLAPNCSWVEPDGAPFAGTWSSPQDVRERVFQPSTQLFESLSVTPSQFFVSGNTVCVLATFTGTPHGGGPSFSIPAAHIWTVENGHVTAFENICNGLSWQNIPGVPSN